MSDQEPKRSPSENFADMVKEFGSAMAEIFNDPKLKEKAKELGESAAASARAFAGRFKDEDVKNKFKNLGKTAKNFGDSVSEYFKDDSEKRQSSSEDTPDEEPSVSKTSDGETSGGQTPGAQTTAGENTDTGEPKKKPENITDDQHPGSIKNHTADKYSIPPAKKEVHRDRSARITGYAFAIAWSIILIIFFNFFNRYIAYYVFDTSTQTWDIFPFVTAKFGTWLFFLNASLMINIIGNIVLIVNDSFYFINITNIVMNLFGIASVSALLMLFPFDFTVLSFSVLSAVLVPILKLVFIAIIVGLSIAVLVRFIKVIIRTVKTS